MTKGHVSKLEMCGKRKRMSKNKEISECSRLPPKAPMTLRRKTFGWDSTQLVVFPNERINYRFLHVNSLADFTLVSTTRYYQWKIRNLLFTDHSVDTEL